MSLITLTTDFGCKDPDIGRLKALILQQVPQAYLLDITHNIMPFDFEEAIYILQNSLLNFPKGSIHLIGIESKTNSQNNPIIIEANKQYFIGNNNGILTGIVKDFDYKSYKLPNREHKEMLEPHIKAVKLLSEGNIPHDFAVETSDLKEIKLVTPDIIYEGKNIKKIIPKVIYNDNYENAVFNLTKKDFETYRKGRKFEIVIGYESITEIIEGYTDFKSDKELLTDAGNLHARFNDFGYLEIFIYQSNQITGGAKSLFGLGKNRQIAINLF